MGSTRIIKIVLFSMLTCFLISGCSVYKTNSNIPSLVDSNHSTHSEVLEESTISQEIRFSDNRSLSIEAVVDPIASDALAKIQLKLDQDSLDLMVQELCLSKYPQINESIIDGASNWSVVADNDTLVFSFGCHQYGPLMGVAKYFDVSKDLNGQMIDSTSTYIPHYITDYIPEGMSISAEEAGSEIGKLLSRYSDFTFVPWSVTAGYDAQEQQGYYYAFMQQQYNGFPVYGNEISKVSAFLSNKGIFSFGGTILLKEHERIKLSTILTLSDAVEIFKENFPVYAIGESVTCHRIVFGYIASLQNDVVSLAPAWVFECTDVSNIGSESTQIRYYNCACFVESGDFWIESL